MLALSEVGLSSGQMTEFCSDLSDNVGYSDIATGTESVLTPICSDQFLFNSHPKAGENLLQTELGPHSTANFEPQMYSSQKLYFSQNPVQFPNQVHFPQPVDQLQMFGQPYKTYPREAIPVFLLGTRRWWLLGQTL